MKSRIAGSLWQSPVAFTPLTDVDTLDEAALDALIRGWYAEAGVRPEDVETGAVIVTGESLKTVNARRTVMRLADSLGDFVVASAGPHLESVIAGRGAGAAALSEARRGTVLNIDIGGGTSNYAVFRAGRVIDTACLNMGGRLAETDGTAGSPASASRFFLFSKSCTVPVRPKPLALTIFRYWRTAWQVDRQVLADERVPRWRIGCSRRRR
ncbi:MAG: ethanolamine ammonia-lyase reactivating factor EutA [Bilophila wadsworthia]